MSWYTKYFLVLDSTYWSLAEELFGLDTAKNLA